MSTGGEPSPDDPSYWVLEAVEAYELPLLKYARRLLNDFGDCPADATSTSDESKVQIVLAVRKVKVS